SAGLESEPPTPRRRAHRRLGRFCLGRRGGIRPEGLEPPTYGSEDHRTHPVTPWDDRAYRGSRRWVARRVAPRLGNGPERDAGAHEGIDCACSSPVTWGITGCLL